VEFLCYFTCQSPCDGIGGTAKQLVSYASLQATKRNHIFTPEDLYQWAKENITGITFFRTKKLEHMI
jgi:hypothetical protein